MSPPVFFPILTDNFIGQMSIACNGGLDRMTNQEKNSLGT